jgi:hypothetical protein
MYTSLLGHLGQMFDIRDGVDYMERLSDEYGDVVRIKGLGVRQNFVLAWIASG